MVPERSFYVSRGHQTEREKLELTLLFLLSDYEVILHFERWVSKYFAMIFFFVVLLLIQ